MDKTVAFVLYPGLTPLDVVGPVQVMSGLEVVEATFGIQPRHHVVVVAEALDADRDSFAARVEGAAHEALDQHPDMLARLLG